MLEIRSNYSRGLETSFDLHLEQQSVINRSNTHFPKKPKLSCYKATYIDVLFGHIHLNTITI